MVIVRRLVLLFAAVVLTSLSLPTFGQDKSSCDACSVVRQALQAARSLQPGMTRADVETDFKMDGGLHFGGTARYVFRKCSAIQVLVYFEGDEPGKPAALLPTDRIVTVSRPYLEYEAMD